MTRAMWLCLKYKRLEKVQYDTKDGFNIAQDALNEFLSECHRTKVNYDELYQYVSFTDAIVEG